MEPVEIAAGALQLRPFGLADVSSLVAACQDPDIARWTSIPSPYTVEHATAFVAEVIPRAWTEETAAPLGVFDATSGDLLASVGLVSLRRDAGLAELGYWTAPWARRRGVATAASLAVARWAFGALCVARLEWLAEVGNVASRTVAERAGFTVEGLLRDRIATRDGGRADAWIGALLPRDLA